MTAPTWAATGAQADETVSVWRRPVTLFTGAAVAAVVVISGGLALVASTRPVDLSAATQGPSDPREDSDDGSQAVDRTSDVPTLAQPERPLVTPVDPSLAPVTVTNPNPNPNSGVGPLRPGAPIGSPDNPTNPAVPTDPADPSNPVISTDPVVPTVPVDPANPVVPPEPVVPAIPVDPAPPAGPTEPFAPTDPANPVAPVDPKDRQKPVKPVKP